MAHVINDYEKYQSQNVILQTDFPTVDREYMGFYSINLGYNVGSGLLVMCFLDILAPATVYLGLRKMPSRRATWPAKTCDPR
jgi:hypothetical protein